MSGAGRDRPFARAAREELDRCSRALLTENEKLRTRAVLLEADLRMVSSDRDFLRAERDSAFLERERAVADLVALRERLADAEADSRRFSRQYLEVEHHSGNLANLYVASYQLHTTLDGAEILDRIVEIVVNLLGSEEFAIYLPVSGGGFRTAASFGLSEDVLAELAQNPELADRAAGESPFVSETPGDGLTAVVPLRIEDRFVGVLVVRRLLPHKPALEPVDRELLDLLATHAAAALHCAALHERCGGIPA